MGLAIRLLGTPSVECDGRAKPAPRGHKVWALLAYLACDGPASRTRLAGLLFEDAEDPLGTLRWNLSELRRLLGDDGLRGDTLSLPPGVQVDAQRILSGSDLQAVPGLERELLEGMSFASSPAFEVWLGATRRRLQAAAEALLHEAALARLAAAAPGQAAELAARLVALNPLDEDFQALLVRSLATAGDGVGAARHAAACRELFRRELGVAPGAALEAALRTSTARPTAPAATGRTATLAQLEAGEAAIAAGALEAGLQCLRSAIAEADATRDDVLRMRSRIALGTALVHAARGRDEEGATALHEALAVAPAASPTLAAAAGRELGYVEFLRGRYERAQVWLRRAGSLAGDDRAEHALIATVLGSTLSDTAHYGAALDALQQAERHAGDERQRCYALAMHGRIGLLRGDLDAAREMLDRSVAMARQGWTAFVPWPLSLRAEIDLLRGDVDAAAERFEHAFALGCQIGDPCWEGLAGRGLGCVAAVRGQTGRAVELLLDALARSARLPDAYVWGRAHVLEALCALAVREALPQAPTWVAELQAVAARCGMRELLARAHLHGAALGDAGSGSAARLLVETIDNPLLRRLACA